MQLNKIYNDDCFNILPQIDSKSIDLILTDLPYGTTKNKWDSVLPMDKLWEEYKRIIKDNGCIALFGQGLFAAKLALSNEDWYKYDIVWKKGNRVTGFLDAKKRPLRNHEQILIFYKKQPTYNPQFTEGQPLHSKGKSYLEKEGKNNNYGFYHTNLPEQRAGSTKKYPKSVIDFDRPHPPVHPTQKPVPLLEWIIKTYTNENDVVLDNTCGIGSTCIASKKTNRNYIGIELNKEYYDIAESYLSGINNANIR
jgi:site-specific DNA-methyltransferase (adenine-specific)